MRARQREKISRRIIELCADEAPELAKDLHVLWCRELPALWGVAHVGRPHKGSEPDKECDILLCETSWSASTEEERADTVAHELAHAIVWYRNMRAETHGPEWQACFHKLLPLAQDLDWH